MIPCGGCRRFVQDTASRCPFCDHAIVNHRSPLGGFLGVVVGVALTACGADDGDDSTSMGSTATMSTTAGTDDSSGTASTTMTTDDSTSSTSLTTTDSEATGPVYGPVTEAGSSDTSDTDTDGTSGTSGTDGSSTDASGSGDSTAAESESVGPLYGPVTNGG